MALRIPTPGCPFSVPKSTKKDKFVHFGTKMDNFVHFGYFWGQKTGHFSGRNGGLKMDKIVSFETKNG